MYFSTSNDGICTVLLQVLTRRCRLSDRYPVVTCPVVIYLNDRYLVVTCPVDVRSVVICLSDVYPAVVYPVIRHITTGQTTTGYLYHIQLLLYIIHKIQHVYCCRLSYGNISCCFLSCNKICLNERYLIVVLFLILYCCCISYCSLSHCCWSVCLLVW